MYTALEEFIVKLSAFNSGQINISELEDSSLILINSDEFGNLDDSVQTMIYKIDMDGLEKLDSKDYLSIEEQLRAYMTAKQQRD
jgi:hypothetical protein